MANSRDFTGKNRKFTGTKGIVTPKGTTGERVGSESGELRFNTTIELMEYYDGNQWKPIDAPPTISSISTSDAQGTNNILNADGSTLHTITITGGNFSIGPNVKFIGSTGTEYTAGNINRVSNSSITCTTLSNMGTTDDPYDVTVINTSGLSATFDDAFSYNAAPVFTVASGQLGTVYNTQVISGTTLNAGATDAEGNTITHTIISGSLPGSGLSISSSTGAITGTLSGSPSLGNYTFVVRAATTEGTVERQFSIQVIAVPFIQATGGTVTTSGDYKIHTFNNTSNFVVSEAGTAPDNAVRYLVVAGGGGGGSAQSTSQGNHNSGGGGGGGGMLFNNTENFTVTAQTYLITVGGGGSGGINDSTMATQGGTSNFSNITAAGGGFGGDSFQPSPSGGNGGSGGGSGVDFDSPPTGGSGGSGNTPNTSPSQGNPGGNGNVDQQSGGGGGAGQAGQPGSGSTGGQGGNGGNGASNDISGSPVTYAGGGGGGIYNNVSGGTGGSGGGGNAQQPGQNGTDNLGGGGGGVLQNNGVAQTGGSGGKGVVIIKYKFQ